LSSRCHPRPFSSKSYIGSLESGSPRFLRRCYGTFAPVPCLRLSTANHSPFSLISRLHRRTRGAPAMPVAIDLRAVCLRSLDVHASGARRSAVRRTRARPCVWSRESGCRSQDGMHTVDTRARAGGKMDGCPGEVRRGQQRRSCLKPLPLRQGPGGVGWIDGYECAGRIFQATSFSCGAPPGAHISASKSGGRSISSCPSARAPASPLTRASAAGACRSCGISSPSSCS
jgi:hypothetical protein